MKGTFRLVMLATMLFSIKNVVSQNRLKLDLNVGSLVGETNNFKKNMSVTAFSLGYEYQFNEKLSLATGAGLYTVRYDYTTSSANVFNQRYYLTVPVTVNRFYKMSDKTLLFWGLGVLNTFGLSQTAEVFTNGNKSSATAGFQGYHLSTDTRVGCRLKLGTKSWVDFSIVNQLDLIAHYKQAAEKLKMQKNMLSFGYNIGL